MARIQITLDEDTDLSGAEAVEAIEDFVESADELEWDYSHVEREGDGSDPSVPIWLFEASMQPPEVIVETIANQEVAKVHFLRWQPSWVHNISTKY